LVLPVRLTGGEDRPSCVWKCTELLRHLLLPTDFSETAAEALCYLELLAPKGVQRVTLVHALSAAAEAQPERGLTDPGVLNARNFLEVLQARVQAAGAAQVDLCLAAGHPVAVIRGILASRGISLVVMGTQGKGYIQELFLGSVAHNVTRLAPCPVLLIPRIERNPGA
jgi:nucleotide-binding universal stress UspA family protein